MSEKSLHQFYQDLIPNLLTELFFFIPEKEFSDDIIQKLDFLKRYNLLNKVYVLDHHYGPMEYEKGRNHKYIFLKRSKLEQSIFRLVEKRSEVKKHEFKYVLNKYFELVDTFLYLTNWMNNNLTKFIEVENTVIGLFHIQFEYFKKHYEELISNFYPNKEVIPKGVFDAHKIIDNYFPDISPRLEPVKTTLLSKLKAKEKIDENILVINANTKDITDNQIGKKDKKALVTEQEAEKILLQTLFNINKNIKFL